MSDHEQIAREVIDRLLKPIGISRPMRIHAAKSLEKYLKETQPAVLPSPNESCAVVGSAPKTASLFFDRLWAPPHGGNLEIPQGILFFGASEPELWIVALSTVMNTQQFIDAGLTDAVLNDSWKASPVVKYLRWTLNEPGAAGMSANQLGTRTISEIVSDTSAISAAPMYDDSGQMAREFKPGSTDCICTAIKELGIVSEDSLEWAQVIEFRKDTEAKLKLRRMRHWLNSDLVGKPISQVTDAIAVRLEDYEGAIQKHGLKTFTGAMTDVLDSRFIAATGSVAGGLWYAAGTGLAELAAGGLVIGRVVFSLADRLIDLADRKRGAGSEVAFVHELKNLSK